MGACWVVFLLLLWVPVAAADLGHAHAEDASLDHAKDRANDSFSPSPARGDAARKDPAAQAHSESSRPVAEAKTSSHKPVSGSSEPPPVDAAAPAPDLPMSLEEAPAADPAITTSPDAAAAPMNLPISTDPSAGEALPEFSGEAFPASTQETPPSAPAVEFARPPIDPDPEIVLPQALQPDVAAAPGGGAGDLRLHPNPAPPLAAPDSTRGAPAPLAVAVPQTPATSLLSGGALLTLVGLVGVGANRLSGRHLRTSPTPPTPRHSSPLEPGPAAGTPPTPVKLLSQWVQDHPWDGVAIYALALELYAARQLEETVRLLDRAFRLYPAGILHFLEAPELERLRARPEVRRVLKRHQQELQRRVWTGYA